MKQLYGSFDATVDKPFLTHKQKGNLLVGLGFVLIMFGVGIVIGEMI